MLSSSSGHFQAGRVGHWSDCIVKHSWQQQGNDDENEQMDSCPARSRLNSRLSLPTLPTTIASASPNRLVLIIEPVICARTTSDICLARGQYKKSQGQLGQTTKANNLQATNSRST